MEKVEVVTSSNTSHSLYSIVKAGDDKEVYHLSSKMCQICGSERGIIFGLEHTLYDGNNLVASFNRGFEEKTPEAAIRRVDKTHSYFKCKLKRLYDEANGNPTIPEDFFQV